MWFLQKNFVILWIALAIGGSVITYHFRAVNKAYDQGQEDIIAGITADSLDDIKDQLIENAIEKEVLDEAVRDLAADTDGLEQKLLIDHDLDAILQRKPTIALKIVNNGTREVFLEFEALQNE